MPHPAMLIVQLDELMKIGFEEDLNQILKLLGPTH